MTTESPETVLGARESDKQRPDALAPQTKVLRFTATVRVSADGDALDVARWYLPAHSADDRVIHAEWADTQRDVVRFGDAQIGDEAYTWELVGGDWGDYRFETATIDGYVLGSDDTVLRKRWRLVDVQHLPAGVTA